MRHTKFKLKCNRLINNKNTFGKAEKHYYNCIGHRARKDKVYLKQIKLNWTCYMTKNKILVY